MAWVEEAQAAQAAHAAHVDTGLGDEEGVFSERILSHQVLKERLDYLINALGEWAIPIPPAASILEIFVFEVVHGVVP